MSVVEKIFVNIEIAPQIFSLIFDMLKKMRVV